MDSNSDSDKIDDINLTTVCNNTYLTPSCANTNTNSKSTPLLNDKIHMEEESIRPSPDRRKRDNGDNDNAKHIFRKVADVASAPQKQSRNGNLIHPAENMSLLIDSGRAKFVNLPDSAEDEHIRITLEC